jgi:hypothetical protein
MTAKHRGRAKDQPLGVVNGRQPRPYGLQERGGHARRGQYLLDQERHAIGGPPHPGDDVLARVRQAGPDHGRYLAVVQPDQRQVPGRLPGLQPPG